jgi:hypothetical protein
MNNLEFRVWVCLITYVDDYGRGDARPEVIKGACFPLAGQISVRMIKTALEGLYRIGCVRPYVVDGKPYLYFPEWERHQRVRNKVSKFPEPPKIDELPQSAASCGESRPESNPIQSNPESNPNPESKGSVARFCPPTVKEVEDFVSENGLNMDAQEFVDYYTNKRWRIGSSTTQMKDWRAAARNWAKKEWRKPAAKKESSFDTDGFFDAAMKRAYGGA